MAWHLLRKRAAQLPSAAESWELLCAAGPDYMDDGVRPQASHLMLIASSLGPIVAVHASEEPPDASMLAEFVTETCLAPSHGEPRRPARVVTADGVIVTRLATELRPTGVRVQHGATPNAMDAYESLMDHLTMPKVADSLSQADNATVRAYFAAADRFYGSRPWEALAAEKFVAFRLEGRPWRYLSIMGHGGDEYGFAVYDDWLDACRMAYAHLPPYPSEWDDGPPDPFSAIDALEGVSLYGLDMASPADAAVIRKLKIRKTWNGQYALVQRFTDQGSVPAINALETYTAVMQVLGERADRARGRKVTSIKAQVDTVHGPVAISYPAKGTEDALPDQHYVIEFGDKLWRRGDSGRFTARATAPHGAKLPHVVSALRTAAKEAGFSDPYLDNLVDPTTGTLIWFGYGAAVEPSPTVGQLATLDGVAIRLGDALEAVTIEPVAEAGAADISASWTETGAVGHGN